jgi:hypothetical protein
MFPALALILAGRFTGTTPRRLPQPQTATVHIPEPTTRIARPIARPSHIPRLTRRLAPFHPLCTGNVVNLGDFPTGSGRKVTKIDNLPGSPSGLGAGIGLGRPEWLLRAVVLILAREGRAAGRGRPVRARRVLGALLIGATSQHLLLTRTARQHVPGSRVDLGAVTASRRAEADRFEGRRVLGAFLIGASSPHLLLIRAARQHVPGSRVDLGAGTANRRAKAAGPSGGDGGEGAKGRRV